MTTALSRRGSDWVFAELDPVGPTTAAINGHCFAGGLEPAAWCDFRIGEEQSQLGALNRRWGVPYFDGGSPRWALKSSA